MHCSKLLGCALEHVARLCDAAALVRVVKCLSLGILAVTQPYQTQIVDLAMPITKDCG